MVDKMCFLVNEKVFLTYHFVEPLSDKKEC